MFRKIVYCSTMVHVPTKLLTSQSSEINREPRVTVHDRARSCVWKLICVLSCVFVPGRVDFVVFLIFVWGGGDNYWNKIGNFFFLKHRHAVPFLHNYKLILNIVCCLKIIVLHKLNLFIVINIHNIVHVITAYIYEK